MKNISMVIILSLGMTIVSCGKSQLQLDRSGGGGGNNPKIFKDVVDMRQCQGKPKPGSNIQGENWGLTQVLGKASQVWTLTVTSSQTTLKKLCANQDYQASVQAQAQSTHDDKKGILTFTSQDNESVGNKRTILCTATLDGKPAQYQLVGNCLLINLSGETHYFVR